MPDRINDSDPQMPTLFDALYGRTGRAPPRTRHPEGRTLRHSVGHSTDDERLVIGRSTPFSDGHAGVSRCRAFAGILSECSACQSYKPAFFAHLRSTIGPR